MIKTKSVSCVGGGDHTWTSAAACKREGLELMVNTLLPEFISRIDFIKKAQAPAPGAGSTDLVYFLYKNLPICTKIQK